MTKKQIVKLAIVIIILVAVILSYVKIKKSSSQDSGEDGAATPSYSVLSFNYEDVTKFTYTYNGDSFTLQKGDDGDWSYVDEPDLLIDSDKITALLDSVDEITSEVKIDSVTDFGQYGLEQPANEVTITAGDREIVFYIGNCNVNTGDYYFRIKDEDVVYTVTGTIGTKFNLPATDFEKEETDDSAAQTDDGDAALETGTEDE